MLLPLLLTLSPALAQAPDEVGFYIGTYTSPKGSKGIYHARFNRRTGAISEPELAVEAPGPSFLALHPNGKFLYAVNEPTDGVSAYAIQPDRRLKLLNVQSALGGAPCHLTLDPKGNFLFVANYMGGNTVVFPVRPDGSLSTASGYLQNTGTGPNQGRQEAAHAHAVYPDPNGKFAYGCDLGTDEILAFPFNDRGELGTPLRAQSEPGAGPRHLALHPNGKFVYANNEMGNSVSTYSLANGAMTRLQTLPTVPDGYQGGGTAEIALHPNGRFLYVSNRGHDSIAVYEIQPDGLLKLVEIKTAGVKIPRGFTIDPSGHWLLVAGQDSHDLTALAIDPEKGTLTPTENRVKVGSPVCLVFPG